MHNSAHSEITNVPRFVDQRLTLALHAALLLAAVGTYFLERDDVVWHFIKHAPHVRAWEHLCFWLAAGALALSIWLRAKLNSRLLSDLLQAVGIGSLVPLSGFILLVAGEAALAVFRPKASAPSNEPLLQYLGPCCAFLSMVVFSITLNDRLADLLFAGTALITVGSLIMRKKSPHQSDKIRIR